MMSMASIQLFAQSVHFSSTTPEQGKTLKFKYDPKGGSLNKLANVSCSIIAMSDRDHSRKIPVKLNKIGNGYEGEFNPGDSTNMAVLVFNADVTTDENSNGYFTKFYKSGKPTAMAIFLEGYLYGGYGKSIAKVKTDLPRSSSTYKQAFEADRNLKKKYLNDYLTVEYALEPTEGQKQIQQTIALYNKNEPSERNFFDIISLYSIAKNSVAVDSVYNVVKIRYPHGDYALSIELKNLVAFNDPYKKEEVFNEILKHFSLDLNNKQDRSKVTYSLLGLADVFNAANNNVKTEYYLETCEQKLTAAILYNKYAKNNISSTRNLEFSERMSKRSIELIDGLKDEDVPAYYDSKEAYLNVLAEYKATSTATYVMVLEALGKYADALAFVDANKDDHNTQMNTMLVSLLFKNGKNQEAIKLAEQLVRLDQGNDRIKADMKKAYYGATSFNNYYANLQRDSRKNHIAKYAKKMINVPAPKFSLMNLNGEKITLEKLKGKVVIIDFWATWCGPCITAFPGMQLAVEKYKDDPKVIFLFINSWEKDENRAKKVREYALANLKFTFNYLLDTKSKVDPTNYDTIERYKVDGIPTKFIVDANGTIRFKAIGSESTAEATLKELDIMIDLAKSAGKTKSK